MANRKSASRLMKAFFRFAIGRGVNDCEHGGSMGVRADTSGLH
jgi:hypothetical protein